LNRVGAQDIDHILRIDGQSPGLHSLRTYRRFDDSGQRAVLPDRVEIQRRVIDPHAVLTIDRNVRWRNQVRRLGIAGWRTIPADSSPGEGARNTGGAYLADQACPGL